MSGYPYCRCFSNEEMLIIKGMTTGGIPPRQILSSIRQNNPNCKAIARTMYSAKAKIINEILAGRTMIEALFEELGQSGFTFDISRDENGHLTHLFFAHPSSIALTKSYPYVFVMDCTYKTNKYRMPLLDIVGVSSFNGSFYYCFAFMQKEEERDYVWALERFSKIVGQHPSVIVSDRELALMNVIQGAHAMLKKYLSVSTGNFREVKEKICLAIDNQYVEIKTKLASEKLRVKHKFRIPMFKELVTHVSNFALQELFNQYELATSDPLLVTCSGHFSNTMGLPCAHIMINKKGGNLILEDIHPQWRIDVISLVEGGVTSNENQIECLLKDFHEKYKHMPLVQQEDSRNKIAQLVGTQIPLIIEPIIQPHKGRPSNSKKRKRDSSTTRDPSRFEIVEKARKCSVCYGVGHNSRTCPSKMRGVVDSLTTIQWDINPSLEL